jgi:hypothetical protein
VAPRALTAVFVAMTTAVVVILILWVYPGFLSTTPSCAFRPTVDGRVYCAETVTLVQGTPCTAAFCPSCPASVATFHGVDFQLVLYNTSSGPFVEGCVVEGNSILYMHLAADPLGPLSVNWTSSDHAILMEWQSPFSTVRTDGRITANLACGVSLAKIEGT